MGKLPIVVIAGPTASGKTGLGVELAKKYNGEVVSCDSMQIYKKMDIGTAKPTKEEMCGIVHHMIDIKEPWENYSVAEYVKDAHEVIADIVKRGKLPVLVGGTGLYMTSLINDVDFSEEKADESIRAELLQIAENEGVQKLLEILRECDPKSYETIHPNNLKRVIRAIEYFKITGKPISSQGREEKDSRYNPLMFMLNPSREVLYERINRRVDIMFDDGLLEEVKGLLDMGLSKKHMAMQGIGYKEVLDYLRGFSTKDGMMRIIKRDSRHYAKRQFTWFNRDERMIKLSSDYEKEASAFLEDWRGI